MNNIKELENQIQYYATKYYNGEPEITDEEFDSLVDKLKMLNPQSEVLTTGWGFSIDKDKIKHKYSHIGSLEKAKTFEAIHDIFKGRKIYISPKLDGLSAVAYYNKGKLIKGITRGNGEYGKDITDKLNSILGSEINDINFTGAVRGELIINDNSWKLLQQKYKDLISPRNFAAGIINRKELDEDIKYIDLVVYKIVGQENEPIFKNREQILDWLKANFRNCIPKYYYPIMNKESWEAFHEKTFEDFKQLGYGLDGLVLTLEDVQYNTQTQGYAYTEMAFKFAAERAITRIKQIEWTLSRTNRLIPVALVEPVELSGAMIQRCTCNNAKWVKDLGLGKDAEIIITRQNEVIPGIVDVIEQSNELLPTKCPICNGELKWDGVDLVCENKLCPNVEASNLQQWCEIIGETDGLQFTIMKEYLDKYEINSIKKLYDSYFTVYNDLNSRQLSITEQKILTFFNKLYKEPVSIEKALLALNIPRLGDKTVKLLACEKDLILSFYSWLVANANSEDTCHTKFLEVVKEATTDAIYKNSNKFLNLQFLLNNNRIIFSTSNSQNLIKIAVTGSLQTMKRKDFENYIKQYGYELSSNLKQCKYLVNNDITSTSTKNKEAKQYNIPIITEQEFLSKLN